MADIKAWHGKTLAEHEALRDAATQQGYRFLSISLYGQTSSPVYAAVMIKRPVLVAQRDWPLMTASQFQQRFDAEAKEGFGPVMIGATGSASDPRFAAVFQKFDPIPMTRYGLGSGDPERPHDYSGPRRGSAQAGAHAALGGLLRRLGQPDLRRDLVAGHGRHLVEQRRRSPTRQRSIRAGSMRRRRPGAARPSSPSMAATSISRCSPTARSVPTWPATT